MREVIQSLIRVEGEAQGIVPAAREEAARVGAEAEKGAQDVVARARREARADATHFIETAVEAARGEKAKRLQAAVAEIESQARIDGALQDRLVKAVVRCICSPR